ncbi:MAG: hypothetical protein J5902_02525 [Paludibacteraceae bacterium]|nr:hypothetical protein [Paludibacteraceae bacterium]
MNWEIGSKDTIFFPNMQLLLHKKHIFQEKTRTHLHIPKKSSNFAAQNVCEQKAEADTTHE